MAELFAVAWVVSQVMLPAAQLLRTERPLPFGWQMYSANRALPEFWVEGAGGEVREIEMDRFVPRPRAELEYALHLPPFLCRELPGTVAVHVRGGAGPGERHPCP